KIKYSVNKPCEYLQFNHCWLSKIKHHILSNIKFNLQSLSSKVIECRTPHFFQYPYASPFSQCCCTHVSFLQAKINQLSSFNSTTVRLLLSPSNHLFILKNKGNECCQVLVRPII
ncbi:hypothetical protein VIGAN_10107400, partial [Vigna angularis var. angularis]